MTELTDEQLMVSYQRGSIDGFNELFERYRSRVFSFLSARIGDTAARDITQEVFLKLHRSRALYKPSMPFAPWFFTLCRHVMFDYLRKKKNDGGASQAILDYQEEIERMSTSAPPENEIPLQELSAREEAIISLHYVDGYSFSQIASRLGLTTSNARKISNRAVQKLRKLITGKL